MNLAELTALYDFSGRTVVITGSTGVLGGEIACALVGCGANVAMLDRNLDPAQGLLDLMGPGACRAVAVAGDVLDPVSLRAAARTVIDAFGQVDCLVNAAGGNKMIGRAIPTSTGAAIRSHTASVTRRLIRSNCINRAHSWASGPSWITRLVRRSRSAPTMPVVSSTNVNGVPMSHIQGR